jgi:translation initiation factor IF-2
MIKYKVKDAAADLGVSNKEIIEILEKHCGVTKKTMTTLEESELDVIFDVITKKNKVENFDEYFAARNNKLDNESKPQQEDKPAKQNAKADNQKKKTDKNDKKPNNKDAKPASKQEKVEVTQEKSVEESAPRKRRVIDTRATNVDVERYNQKYDDLASDSSKGRSTDNIVKKQKSYPASKRQTTEA